MSYNQCTINVFQINEIIQLSNSYTMVCPPVQGDNPQVLYHPH